MQTTCWKVLWAVLVIPLVGCGPSILARDPTPPGSRPAHYWLLVEGQPTSVREVACYDGRRGGKNGVQWTILLTEAEIEDATGNPWPEARSRLNRVGDRQVLDWLYQRPAARNAFNVWLWKDDPARFANLQEGRVVRLSPFTVVAQTAGKPGELQRVEYPPAADFREELFRNIAFAKAVHLQRPDSQPAVNTVVIATEQFQHAGAGPPLTEFFGIRLAATVS